LHALAKYAHEQSDADQAFYAEAEAKARGVVWGCGVIPIRCRGSGGGGGMVDDRDWFPVRERVFRERLGVVVTSQSRADVGVAAPTRSAP